MKRYPKIVIGFCVGLFLGQGDAFGQSFPIVPVSDPVYPANDFDLSSFGWDIGAETLDRLGDLDGDGVEELVVLFSGISNWDFSQTKMMWVYRQDGLGGFGAPELIEGFSLQPGDAVEDFAIDDFDGDGLDDIVLVVNGGEFVVPWINTGDGFTPGQQLTRPAVPAGAAMGRLMIEDIDLDGDDDYIVWNNEVHIGLWKNAGGGSYAYEDVADFATTNPRMVQVALSDFEGDGDLDILIIDGTQSELSWIERTASGYEPPVEWGMEASNFYVSFSISTFGDLNGDGLLDVVVRIGRNFGVFLAPFTVGEVREVPVIEFPEFDTDSRSFDFLNPDYWGRVLRSPGDLDGDGTGDLILKPYEGRNTAWRISDPLNINGRFGVSEDYAIHGEGSFAGGNLPEENLAYRSVYLDTNQDGALDLIVPAAIRNTVGGGYRDQSSNGVMLWSVLGNPFDPDRILEGNDSIQTTGSMSHVVATDIDFDGEPELLYTRSGFVKLVDQMSDGKWVYDRFTRFRNGQPGFRTVVASFDSDSRVDLVSAAIDIYASFPCVYKNIELSNFDSIVSNDAMDQNFYQQKLSDLEIYFNITSSSFAVGDVNGDGQEDIVVRGAADVAGGLNGYAVLAWINDGKGGFTVGPISAIERYIGTETHFIELLDHDHDGDLDLVSIGGTRQDQVLGVYSNDGTGEFSLSNQVVLWQNQDDLLVPYWIEVDDLDQDGFDDVIVLVREPNKHEVVVFYGQDDALSSTPVSFSGGGAAEVIAVDIDENGLLDLISCAYESSDIRKNSVSIMFQTEPRVFAPMISIYDLDLTGINTVDMNQDGGLDLVATESVGPNMRVFYSVPEPCVADLNLDRTHNFMDISLFIQLFSQRRPIADINRDGRFNFFDISVFLDAYRLECD
jgi:VCBS repeat protein